MSTRIVLIDYVQPLYSEDGDRCTGCPRLVGDGRCQHFGALAKKPRARKTYLRHPRCITAEERTRHAAGSAIMIGGDFSD